MNTQSTPRVFDKANPCDKIDLQNFFYRNGEYVMRNVVDALAEIGPSSPKYLRGKGYMTQFMLTMIDRYALTPQGMRWLSEGVTRHLELHPEDAARLREPIIPPRTDGRKPYDVKHGNHSLVMARAARTRPVK